MKRDKMRIVLKRLTRKDHAELLDVMDDPAWHMVFEGWSDGTDEPPKSFVVEKRHLEDLYLRLGNILKRESQKGN